jgi:hypothetical protein
VEYPVHRSEVRAQVVVLEDNSTGEQLGADGIEIVHDEPGGGRLVGPGVVRGIDPELGSTGVIEQLFAGFDRVEAELFRVPRLGAGEVGSGSWG